MSRSKRVSFVLIKLVFDFQIISLILSLISLVQSYNSFFSIFSNFDCIMIDHRGQNIAETTYFNIVSKKKILGQYRKYAINDF